MSWIRERIMKLWDNVWEYETSRVVTVQYVPLGILKLFVQICVLTLYIVYHWSHGFKGFQTFAQVKSSVTTKVCKNPYMLSFSKYK